MDILAHSKLSLLSPDKNPILRYFLKKTFYRQFCAGENAAEVRRTVVDLKNMGFKGVMLSYAKEVVLDQRQEENLASCSEGEASEACIRDEITPWARGTLDTVKLTSPGDFVALKFTGAGSQALYALANQANPPPALKDAIDAVCDSAASSGVRLLFDAEQSSLQTGVDAWTLGYMRKYNRSDRAVVYGTYQAYLKRAPSVLASHLSVARKEGFALGVKLVRGAYIGSDTRHLIHDTKADTDNAFDSISESLVRRTYGPVLRPAEGESNQPFPAISVVVACHNLISVRKVQALRSLQAAKGEEQIDLVYAQLQGMADEVSCELLQAGQAEADEKKVDIPSVYKYLTWGSTAECMKYLLRRAQENKDAMQRTREGRNAMAGELFRRFKAKLGIL